jgi:hypothetical protein
MMMVVVVVGMQAAQRLHGKPLDSELYFLRASVRAEAKRHAGACEDLTTCIDVRRCVAAELFAAECGGCVGVRGGGSD